MAGAWVAGWADVKAMVALDGDGARDGAQVLAVWFVGSDVGTDAGEVPAGAARVDGSFDEVETHLVGHLLHHSVDGRVGNVATFIKR